MEKDDALAAGLVYVSDAVTGIARRRTARGFRYVDANGRPLHDAGTLRRIRALAIPPAYESVWICPDSRGHLQATGRDARGRKQYRYHARWRTERDLGKFGRMADFGRSLPALRRRLSRDLDLPGLPREKVLALVVSLLDRTHQRIGNREYARSNDSFGLTTLRDRHVEFLHGRALFRFRGKGGQWQEVSLDDARLVRLVQHCQQLPGQPLFQYVDDGGARQAIDSGMVNDYLRSCTGGVFTAKDFRTWAATVRAIARLAATPLPARASERACAACIMDVVREVARALGNTPAVCRKSYIHPGVFDLWRSGGLAESGRRRPEALALAFLRRERATTGRAALARRKAGPPPAAG